MSVNLHVCLAQEWKKLGFTSREDFIIDFWEGFVVQKDPNNLLTMLDTWQVSRMTQHLSCVSSWQEYHLAQLLPRVTAGRYATWPSMCFSASCMQKKHSTYCCGDHTHSLSVGQTYGRNTCGQSLFHASLQMFALKHRNRKEEEYKPHIVTIWFLYDVFKCVFGCAEWRRRLNGRV